ncbi:hemopexin repeat-containing protein [Calothrix sp. CCY 0018]|uniref:hemopexin repeat-containing protein n=1 Tax=Calothrix sp. CCY 0018 TaxID=3103864 RepID=UPI0039C74032
MSTNPDLPSYEELFGKLNFKKGDDGRSVYSPAAYLTDLLQLLDDNFEQPQLDRREDIKSILLNSENTYGTIPYLDIVNQVLEEKVSQGDVYEDMRTAKYPFNLPFNYENERVKKFLNYLNITNESLYKSFSRQTDYNIVAREYLGLSEEEYNTYIIEENREEEIRKSYNNQSFSDLKQVEYFLKITEISGSELRELLYQNLNGEETDRAANFFINYKLDDYSKLDENEENIIGIKDSNIPVWYERVNRFIRISKKIGISFTDLDIILRSCCKNKLDAEAIKNIAVIKQLHDLSELPYDVICAFFSDINILGIGEDQPQDLFNRIFNLKFTDIDQQYISVSEFIPEAYSNSTYTKLACSGDILALSNKVYRIRLSRALGIYDKDLSKIIEKFRSKSSKYDGDELNETPLDICKNSEEYQEVELSALSLLFRIGKLTETLDISYDDLFNLFDILETDPTIRRYSNFDILIERDTEILDCYQIISRTNVDSIWLVQILFSIVKWMKTNQFTTQQLKFVLTGKFQVDEVIKVEEEKRKQEKIIFLNQLYQQFKPTALSVDLFDSDLFDNRAARIIYQTLTSDNQVSSFDNRLVKYKQDSVNQSAYQALKNIETFSKEDFMYLGLEQNLLDRIFNALILQGYIDTEGKLNEEKIADSVKVKIETDFSDYRKDLFELILNLIANEVKLTDEEDEEYIDIEEEEIYILDVAIYPSDLAVFTLTEEQRQELYDNLIVNGYINDEGTILKPDFFTTFDSYSLFEVNTKIKNYSAEIFQVIFSRVEKFEQEKITLNKQIFSALPLTEAEISDLMENLQFNEYIDGDNIFINKESLLTQDVKEFKLALVFYPYRHKILKAIQELIDRSKSSFYVFTKESFTEIADKIVANLIFESIKIEYLNDDGIIGNDEKSFFLEPDNLAEFTIDSDFTDQETEAIFNKIGQIISSSGQYQFNPEILDELDFDIEEREELIDILADGFLLESGYIPEDKIDYFLNINNALIFNLEKFEDYNKDIFFAIHSFAKTVNSAIEEISEKVREIAEIQQMVLLDVSQEIFGLEKDILKVIFDNFFQSSDRIVEEFMVPVLAVVNNDDTITEEPNHNKFNFTYRRIQQFALLVSILRLNRKEVEIILEDQDIVEKFPEKLILPENINSIDALWESPEGIIYLFKDNKYWTYSAETYNQFKSEELTFKLTEIGYSQTLANRISRDNHISSLSNYFKDISHIDAALVDKNGKSFIFAGGESYSKEKDSTRWVKEKQVWGLVESDFESPEHIDGSFQDKAGKTYLFFGDQYIRYSNGSYDFVDEGYPLEIAGNWKNEGFSSNYQLPVEFHKSIDASFQGTDDKIYLFKDNSYICSENSSQRRSISQTWGKVKNNFENLSNIDAAYVDSGQYYIFAGNQVIVYQNCLENDGLIVESGFPRLLESYYPNLPAEFKNGINAAFKGEDGKVYLFKDNKFVSFYAYDNDTPIIPSNVKQHWGIVPNSIIDTGIVNAAFVGLDGHTYVFGGNQYVRYSGDDYSQVDCGYPRTIEDDWGGLIHVDAAFILDGKTYLFGMDSTENTVYVRYSTNDYTELDQNYPQEPNDNWWNLPFSLVEEGAAFHRIDAVLNSSDDKVYLFSNNKFIYFDNKQRWWSEPQDLNTHWDSIPFESVDAAFTGKDGKTYLFSGTEYLRYSGNNYNQVEDRYPNITNRYWGNVINNIAKTGKVDAAVVVTSQAEYNDYQLELTTSQLPDYRRNTIAIAKFGDNYQVRIFDSNGSIVGGNEFAPDSILRNKIDSALLQSAINRQIASEIIAEITFTLNYTITLIHTYLFSGDQYYRYQGNQYDVVEEGYPKYISTSLHQEPRFQMQTFWSGKIDAAFADRRHIYLFQGTKCHVVSERLYQAYSYNDLDIGQVKCAFLEDSLYIADGNSWNRFGNIEGQEVRRNSVEPPILRNVPDKFKTELDAVLHGVDRNTYLFKGADCFNILLNKEYPLNEEWGIVRNNIYLNKSIDAAFVGLDGKTYLFSDHQYVTYSGNTYIKEEIERLPQEISEHWGGLTTVALAFVKDDKTYLFEKADPQGNSRYVCYSTADYSQPDSGFPQVADIDFWQIPHEYTEVGEKSEIPQKYLQVNAALFENDNMFLVTGKHYLQFNNLEDSWAYPKPLERIWRDIPFKKDIFDRVKTAFTGKDGKTYFFSDEYYVTYDGSRFTEPTLIEEDWGIIDNNFVNNGLQNKVDAAFVWQNKITYLFSGDQYVRYSTADYRYVDTGYPKFIVDLTDEPGFNQLPEQFTDTLTDLSVNETDTLINAIVANNRNLYIFMDNHIHVVSQKLSENYDIEIIGKLKNSIVENNHVDAAFVNGSRQTFLFSGDNYVRYSQDEYEYVDDGYPKAIADLTSEEGMSQFTASFKYGIDAAVWGADGNIYLFKGQEYQSSAELEPRPIQDKWGKIKNNFTDPDTSINAGFVSERGYIYLFKGNQYIRYSESNQKYVDQGFPKSIKDNWGNLPVHFEQSIDSAFVLEGKTYFLKGDEYVRYSDEEYQSIDSIYPQKFEYRWGNWSDYLLNDIKTITRFKQLQDNYSNGDYTLVNFLHYDQGEIPDPYQMLAEIFDWDIDDLKWLKRNNAFLTSDSLEVKFNLEIAIKLFDIFEVIKKMGASPKEIYQQVWLKMYSSTNKNLKSAADTLYKFLALIHS